MLNFKEIEGAGSKLFEDDSTDLQTAADSLSAMRFAFSYLQPTPESKMMYSIFMLRGQQRTGGMASWSSRRTRSP
ncbi:hypothetical protein LINGRAHAP2_LOCUS34408, partial [Linum grandiflorum]